MSAINELALLLKERDNTPYMGPITGIVVSPPPSIKVSVGDKIILDNSHLIIAAHVLAEYERKATINGVSTVASSDITKLAGELQFNDTLAAGDEVILMPSADIQTYFLIDKAVRL